VGIFGRSGVGKTVLAHCAVGLLRPSYGKVLHRGRDIYIDGEDGYARSPLNIQMVFQDPFSALNPNLTMEQTITRSLSTNRKSSGDVRKALERILEEVGLSSKLLRQRPTELSGGECQRVCLAQSLAAAPDLLVLDEPVSMLDPIARSQVIGSLGAIFSRAEITVLYIAQEYDIMRTLCQRTIYLGRSGAKEVDVTRGFGPPRGGGPRLGDAELDKLIAAARQLDEFKKRRPSKKIGSKS
jgi:ABC-type glutathione transport system ATPase component